MASRNGERAKKRGKRVKRQPAPPPRDKTDVAISSPVVISGPGINPVDISRLVFDGYTLAWQGASAKSYSAFSGAADESFKEDAKDFGPTPQGKFTVDPANIEYLEPSDDWGSHRVRLDPLLETVDRMKDCLKVLRTGMYIHGGNVTGTHGCIELNDDGDEESFFDKLKAYGKKIELEVKYAGDRKAKYEPSACPYPQDAILLSAGRPLRR